MKTRLVVADFHTAIRELLAGAFIREGRYEVVGQAGTGVQALALCARLRPEVLILSLLLPELNGAEVLRRLPGEAPGTRAVVFSGAVNHRLLVEAVRRRPHGFVHKSDSLATLLEAVAAVARGASFYSPLTAAWIYESAAGGARAAGVSAEAMAREAEGSYLLTGDGEAEDGLLTERERDVLHLVAEGLSSKLVAERLQLGVRTVDNYRARLMDKLHVPNAAGLARYAVSRGLVPARSEGTEG